MQRAPTWAEMACHSPTSVNENDDTAPDAPLAAIRMLLAQAAACEAPRELALEERLRSHVICLGEDGRPRADGAVPMTEETLARIFTVTIPEVTSGWAKKRLLLFIDGGMVDERSALERLDAAREHFIDEQIYPVMLLWKTGVMSAVTQVLRSGIGATSPSPRTQSLAGQSLSDSAGPDEALDVLDGAIERFARRALGKQLWDEVKRSALDATLADGGGGRLILEQLFQLVNEHPEVEVHVAAHSAGAIVLAPLVKLLTSVGSIATGELRGEIGLGVTVKSCTLWAPACTTAVFDRDYRPAVESGQIEFLSVFALSDEAERTDDCGGLYHKSLLYLVSNALEELPCVRGRGGTPILGLERFASAALADLEEQGGAELVLGPADGLSAAKRHGEFLSDPATLRSTVVRIVNAPAR